MAAPRATQFLALRNLARGSQQVRHLHMTGPATYASPVLTKERPVLNLPRDVVSLRAECKRRKIEASGSESDLIARLNADELAHSRTFSTSAPLNAARDNSTIDFFYFPDVDSAEDAADLQVRVPILPTTQNTSQPALEQPEDTSTVMKPEISTMSADAVFLPMSEITDGHGMNIDFHAMADRVAANLRRMRVPVEQRAGMMKQIWNDMVDDLAKASLKGAAV